MSDIRQPSAPRVAAIDTYRGMVMFLMMAEVLHLSRVASACPACPVWQHMKEALGPVARLFPGDSVWQFLSYHQSHVEWSGCSLHDLIQPSFSFLVGVAVPFSIVSRLARGQSVGRMLWHAAWRAVVLVLLGVFLRSVGKKQTYWTFEDTLSQIGLGYLPLFGLGLATFRLGRSETEGDPAPRNQSLIVSTWICWTALFVALVGYWAAFACYPLPDSSFDYGSVGVPANWPHLYSGFAAHWNKNSNLAWAFDTWFLNLFPREKAFTHNGGGYATLSFIPTLGTMILGLIAGEWLRRGAAASSESAVNGDANAKTKSPWHTVGLLVVTGLGCLAAGYALDKLEICPSVKKIWTPGWTLFSGGWCFLFLAFFYSTLDAIGRSAWSFPLRVIGANSIAAYCIAHLWGGFIISSFKTNIGPDAFSGLGTAYEPLLQGGAVLLVYWLILLWMYRRGIFLRI
jgi:heparan-alpha-glucosaminide N-acetyltransferase